MHGNQKTFWQRWWWAALALFLVYSAAGLSRLSYDVDVSRLLPNDLPQTEGFRAFLRHFAKRGEMILTLEMDNADAALESSRAIAKALEARPELVKRVVWQRDESDVAQWSELAAWTVLNQSPEVFKNWEKQLEATKLAADLEARIQELADTTNVAESKGGYDPLGLLSGMLNTKELSAAGSEFSSAKGTFRVLYIESVETLGDYRKASAWVEEIRALALGVAPKATIRVTGDPAIKAEVSRTMEGDMKESLAVTLVLIGLLVWFGYRNVRLLPLLLVSLFITFVLTLATCGLFLGSLTALTVGFGAILIGLSADYGVMVYQRSQEADGNYEEGAKRSRLGIFWAAATTSVVFLALIPLGFPGLSELGLLVAGGVVIGAFVMLGLLPRALKRWGGVPRPPRPPGWFASPRWDGKLALGAGALLAVATIGLIAHGMPKVDVRSGSLRPKVSEAFSTMALMRDNLTGSKRGISVLIEGRSEDETAERVEATRQWMKAEQAAGRVQQFALSQPFVNAPDHRVENFAVARRVVEDAARLKQAVIDAGFTDEAWTLTEGVIGVWKQWLASDHPETFRPVHPGNQWMLHRVTSVLEHGKDSAALGYVTPAAGIVSKDLATTLPPGVFLTGPDVLNETLDALLEKGFVGISVLFGGVTLALLAFALRSWRSLALVLVCIVWSYAALLGSMAFLGVSWNFFTLPAMLLSLGTGSDYFIYVILELRQVPEPAAMRRRIGGAILICVGNSVIGFASLLGANCTGLASMGLVCALALSLNTLCALFVMPPLYRRWCQERTPEPEPESDEPEVALG